MDARHTLPIAIAFLFLAGEACALSENSSAIIAFALQAVPSNQTYSIQPFPLGGSTGFAVVSNNEVYALFASGVPLIDERPLSGEAEISSALEAYYDSQGYSPNITFSDVHAGLVSVMQAHEKGEAKCRILTGTDRTPCTDFLSCQKACYSVTSFCQPIALGVGRPFINEIWKFENYSRELDEAYLNESVAYSALSGGITYDSAKAYLDSLIEVNRAATRASSSALYDGYSYCFEPDYALPVITNMELSAQKAFARAEPFFTLPAQAQLVRQRTLDALMREPKPPAAAASNLTANSSSQEANISAPVQNTSSAQQPAAPQAPLLDGALPIAGAAALIIAFMAGAYFIAVGRKKKV